MAIGGVGQAGTAAALATVEAGGANQGVGVAMLKKAMDASTSSTAQLLESMPSPAPAASGAGKTLGGNLDVRL